MKHPPITQGLELATDASVSDAWEEFFRLCSEYATIVRQRRAENLKDEKEAGRGARRCSNTPNSRTEPTD